MRRMLIVAVFGGAVLAGCPEDKGGTSGATGAAEATSASTVATTAAPSAVAATVAPPPSQAPSAVPASSASAATASASASAAPSGAPSVAPSGSAEAGAKTFDCGAKGQKACPMQGWMKGVMGAAASSGDGEKLAAAFTTCASRPVAGFGSWASISQEGAAKAKAGDIDGAKKACEKCHGLYKKKYQTTMRDRPW